MGRAWLSIISTLALRLHPVLPSNSRVAYQNTVLPKGGGPNQQSPIFIAKGTMVSFGIAAMHRRKDLWGEHAEKFQPERWKEEESSWVRAASFHHIWSGHRVDLSDHGNITPSPYMNLMHPGQCSAPNTGEWHRFCRRITDQISTHFRSTSLSMVVPEHASVVGFPQPFQLDRA